MCTINPNPSAVDESLSTLNFAKRIKKVGLNAKRNEVEGGGGAFGAEAQALILRYQTEADALRKMVSELQRQGPQVQQEAITPVDDERIRELQERLDVIGSLVVRGGRAYDTGGNAEDSADEDARQEVASSLRTPSGSGSTISASTLPPPVAPLNLLPLVDLRRLPALSRPSKRTSATISASYLALTTRLTSSPKNFPRQSTHLLPHRRALFSSFSAHQSFLSNRSHRLPAAAGT